MAVTSSMLAKDGIPQIHVVVREASSGHYLIKDVPYNLPSLRLMMPTANVPPIARSTNPFTVIHHYLSATDNMPRQQITSVNSSTVFCYVRSNGCARTC
jgi:hypothetical protein